MNSHLIRRRAIQAILESLEARKLMSATFDVNGVQPAALDQPQVNVLFRRSPDGPALLATDPFTGDTSFDVQAFLDTGTSGVLLSAETTAGLGINQIFDNGTPINFYDVGVVGTSAFNVSEPLYADIAPFSPNVDGTDESTFTQKGGPYHVELNPVPVSGSVSSSADEPIDIAGMAVLQNKVMVMDPKPPDTLNFMNTYIYDPGTPFNAATADTDPGIPDTTYQVQTDPVDFSRFTLLDPADATGPTLAGNPMIGPNPINQIDSTVPAGNAPPVSMSESIDGGSYNAQGSFLFDSGSASSFISQQMAADLHVHYAPGTYGTDNPILVDDNGQPLDNQFQLPIGGTSGSITAAGFYMSSLSLPTKQGVPIRFINAPVLVIDVNLDDSVTGKTITLDGDFGMNYIVGSLALDNTGSLSGSRGTPWDWVTYDQTTGLLGFAPSTGTSGGGIGINDAHIFYNNSFFDGYTTGVSASDLNAIAPDKQPLLPGETATFANYTSYSKGINGVFVDVVGVPNQLTLNDFSFMVGNSNDPSTWTAAPTPSLTYMPGQGDGGTDRYELIWPDGAIRGQWLQISVLPTVNSTLPSSDSIYFGNAPGETGNDPNFAYVDGSDFAYARDDPHDFLNPAAITDRGDFNRDSFVDGTDLAIARDGATSFLNALNLITVPSQSTGLSVPALSTSSAALAKRKAPLFLTELPGLDGVKHPITAVPTAPTTPTPTSSGGSSSGASSSSTPTPTAPPSKSSTPPPPIAVVPPPPPPPSSPVGIVGPLYTPVTTSNSTVDGAVVIATGMVGPIKPAKHGKNAKAHHVPASKPAPPHHHAALHSHKFSNKRLKGLDAGS
ncbi:MAG TPA: hypothetical protein VFW23_04445 [Tepidisphaeraceae bacterium]|nr:hypothetical protein [Tepidisphaeraceae bacterium]